MLVGILILLLGLFYLLELIIPAFAVDYSIIWPLMLIVAAAYFTIKKGKFDFGNALLLFIGTWWFLVNINVIPNEMMSYFWPLVLIIVGSSIIVGSITFTNKLRKVRKDTKGAQNYYGIFGGVDEKVNNKDFAGANIYSIFGGCDIDFTEVELEKNGAYIYVYSIFGGSEIKLPKKYNIVYNSTAIIGGDENKAVGDPKSKKTIYVNSVSIFGGSEIK